MESLLTVALILGKNDPGFVHNGPLAGLVAVCAGSDLMHPIGVRSVANRRVQRFKRPSALHSIAD